MHLFQLVEASTAVSATRGRRLKVERLSELLSDLPMDEVRIGVNYLMGSLPQGRVGVGPAALREADPEAISTPSLTLSDTDASLQAIGAVSGAGSKKQRLMLWRELLAAAAAAEQDFLRRLLLGELRQGALEGFMIDAIAMASAVDQALVRRAAMLSGDLAAVAESALVGGVEALVNYRLQFFRPLKPMLAQPADGLGDVMEEGVQFALEYKLDGARVQVHKDGDAVRVYTRQLNDVTESVPEIVAVVRSLTVNQTVLDGEAIALGAGGQPQPFQVTMRRFGRRHAVERLRETLPLTVQFFDCLHLDGDDLIDRPGEERHHYLVSAVPDALRVPRLLTDDREVAEAFLTRALSDGHEGIMAKSLAATYRAGSRGADWYKIKPVHTLDLVVLAAEWGSGRRKGRLSNLHLGARDAVGGGFVMLGKTFKGLTDAMLNWQTEQLLARETGRDDYIVYVRPELVVEIAFNELQKSAQYPAGLALRFARVKAYRPDKAASEADTLDMAKRIHVTGFRG